jgi:hypothetical protein
MEIINFQCGHCGNLMGVSSECLGQQVRCPICSQVVVAPAAPQPDPMFPAIPSPQEHEDIFTPPEQDDLFNTTPTPRLEIPAHPSDNNGPTPTLPGPAPKPGPPPKVVAPLKLAPPPEPEPLPPPPFLELNTSQPFAAPAPEPSDASPDEGFRDEPVPSTFTSPAFQEAESAGAETLVATGPSFRRQPQRRSMWPILVLLPLLSYAVLVTVALLLIYQRWQADKAKAASEQKPLDQLPDVDGDSPGVKRSNLTWEVKDQYAWPMPDRLKVGLGQKLQVGDLEIQPLRVECLRVSVFVEGPNKNKEQMDFDSLVLHLRLRNTSEHLSFVPLDPYFDRGWAHEGAPPVRPREDDGPEALERYRQASNQYWEKGKGSPPLTVLEVGERRFFGSSSDWYDRKRSAAGNYHRAWVEGRLDKQPYLKPGETLETFVSTDGRDPRLDDVLSSTQGPLLYRIHLRRGLVQRTRGDEISATAVIGVTFSTQDIQAPTT